MYVVLLYFPLRYITNLEMTMWGMVERRWETLHQTVIFKAQTALKQSK